MPETLYISPRGRPRPAKLTSSRKRVLRAACGRPHPRSVDSECIGCVIEPRKMMNVEADAVRNAEGCTGAPKGHGSAGSTGVRERGMYTRGMQELERSRWLLASAEAGSPRTSTRGHRRPLADDDGAREGTRTERARQVPRNEGNEVMWDGHREVGDIHSTDETGEPAPRGPGGGKGCPVDGLRARER